MDADVDEFPHPENLEKVTCGMCHDDANRQFTYWEKFDYRAVFWGVRVIGLSGFLRSYSDLVRFGVGVFVGEHVGGHLPRQPGGIHGIDMGVEDRGVHVPDEDGQCGQDGLIEMDDA
jgi:hypothetical protein